MKREELNAILKNHKLWLETNGREGVRADLSDVNLREADLSSADLREADLRGADLRGADLRHVNLRGADLSGADLRHVNLRGADFKWADLSDVNLREADLSSADLSSAYLRGADLCGANLDYSCWPLWCGGLNVKTDRRIMGQLAYYFCSQDCDDPDYIAARNAILDFANQFHRGDEDACGRLEAK